MMVCCLPGRILGRQMSDQGFGCRIGRWPRPVFGGVGHGNQRAISGTEGIGGGQGLGLLRELPVHDLGQASQLPPFQVGKPMPSLVNEPGADVDLKVLQIEQPVQELLDEGGAGEDANEGLMVEGIQVGHGRARVVPGGARHGQASVTRSGKGGSCSGESSLKNFCVGQTGIHESLKALSQGILIREVNRYVVARVGMPWYRFSGAIDDKVRSMWKIVWCNL